MDLVDCAQNTTATSLFRGKVLTVLGVIAVGFLSFVFVVAALWHGRLDTMWARWIRLWTTIAWAYYELGWGGWWFWDPVENASLMPWLAGVALLHALSATEKCDVFKIWTAFSLSLVGTFLVRSGVLTSLHAFASDSTRGLYTLLLLGIISGSAFLLLILYCAINAIGLHYRK